MVVRPIIKVAPTEQISKYFLEDLERLTSLNSEMIMEY